MYRFKTAIRTHFRLVVFGAAAFTALWLFLLRYPPGRAASPEVFTWWAGLCAVSVLNICAWRVSAGALARRKAAEPEAYLFQRRQLLLSAVYVVGCAFRSILPRADVQRIGLFDSWVSSVILGRSVATVAEVCFVAQWALLLNQLARDAGARRWVTVSRLLVPLILVAEACSWYAVLTTCYLGNAFEESIWALCASCMVISFIALWPRQDAAYRPFLVAGFVIGSLYVGFMIAVDVPMYVSRWLADEAQGRAYLSLSQGLWDVGSRWVVTFAWEDWRTEIPWMSLYFSVGVWCSIALVHAPGPRRNEAPALAVNGELCAEGTAG
jgi:hypothetical protein